MSADNQSMILRIGFLLLAGWVSAGTLAFGADEASEDQGVKHNGVVFNIAKDRKIEKIGGIYEPENLDKYVERKINGVNERIAGLEKQIEESNKKLDEVLKKLNEAPSSSAQESGTSKR